MQHDCLPVHVVSDSSAIHLHNIGNDDERCNIIILRYHLLKCACTKGLYILNNIDSCA